MVSGGGAGAGTDAGPRRTQSAVAKLLRADLGTETYGELKSLARAWQHGELATGELVAHARHYLGGDLGPLLDLAAFLPVRFRSRGSVPIAPAPDAEDV